MRTYELMLLIRPNPDEAVATQVTEWVAGLIKDNGGQVVATNVWGRRKLAYPIDNQSEGFYVLLKLAAPPAALKGIEFELKLNDNLLRYLFVKDETIDLPDNQEDAEEPEEDVSDEAAAEPAVATAEEVAGETVEEPIVETET